MPVGLQIVAPHFCEHGMFEAAHAVEQALDVDVVAPLVARSGAVSPSAAPSATPAGEASR